MSAQSAGLAWSRYPRPKGDIAICIVALTFCRYWSGLVSDLAESADEKEWSQHHSRGTASHTPGPRRESSALCGLFLRPGPCGRASAVRGWSSTEYGALLG